MHGVCLVLRHWLNMRQTKLQIAMWNLVDPASPGPEAPALLVWSVSINLTDHLTYHLMRAQNAAQASILQLRASAPARAAGGGNILDQVNLPVLSAGWGNIHCLVLQIVITVLRVRGSLQHNLRRVFSVLKGSILQQVVNTVHHVVCQRGPS